jgi:hypothetical protein
LSLSKHKYINYYIFHDNHLQNIMEETKSVESRQMVNIAVRKSNFAEGIDRSSKWKEHFAGAISRTILSPGR